MNSSPLTEVNKNSLADLFAKDPCKLTKEDVTEICRELRAKRNQWATEDAKPKRKKESINQGDMNDLLNNLIF